MRLVNTGFSLGLRFWIDRHHLTIIARDGIDLDPMAQTSVEAVFLHVGERIDVRVDCTQDPTFQYMVYVMVAYEYYGKHAHLKTPNVSSFAILDYGSTINNIQTPLYPPETWPRPQAVNFPYDSRLRTNTIAPAATRRFIVDSVSKGHWWNYENDTTGRRLEWWEMNNHTPFYIPANKSIYQECERGRTFSDIYGMWYGSHRTPLVYHLEYDPQNLKTYEFVLFNNEAQPHPWHVHGHTVDVLEIGQLSCFNESDLVPFDQETRTWMRVDTFTIPSRSYAVFRITANNPGPWMVHCHMNYHALVGMSFLISTELQQRDCNYDFKTPLYVATDLINTFGFVAIIATSTCFCMLAFFACFRAFSNWRDVRTNHKALLNHYSIQAVPLVDTKKERSDQ